MRDWSKFAWKKGDVLCCGVDNLCIFKSWANNSYTEFNAMYVTNSYASSTCPTEKWTKETNENIIKQYIAQIEEIKGGKLNLKTLDIEHPKQEFKDGDIVRVDEEILIILKRDEYFCTYYHFFFRSNGTTAFNGSFNKCGIKYRLATDSEKRQLFDALAKEGKRWNPDTLQVEDLPKKCEFKAFQKVLTRDTLDEKWIPNLFSNYNREHSDYMYGCIAGGVYSKYCIPYNKETAHLLGTTDEWKGGK